MFIKCLCEHCQGHIEFDKALQSGVKPTRETQAKSAETWGDYWLANINAEISKAIEIIGNENPNINALKDAKRNIKEVVQKFTEMIDEHIATIQDEKIVR
jgi:hypothetical protein